MSVRELIVTATPMEEKNLQMERLVFFSDAVVAIAITLLALELKIERTESGHLHFADIWAQWRTFAAFGLSFFNIANFWKVHHNFFAYINRIDEKLLWCNILWLLFIVLLPFSTSLVSNYFSDVPAMTIYSINMLLVAVCQNAIWDYSSVEGHLAKEKMDGAFDKNVRLFCNLDMVNSGLGLLVAFFSPMVAFLLLVTKLPMIALAWLYFGKERRRVS